MKALVLLAAATAIWGGAPHSSVQITAADKRGHIATVTIYNGRNAITEYVQRHTVALDGVEVILETTITPNVPTDAADVTKVISIMPGYYAIPESVAVPEEGFGQIEIFEQLAS